MGKTSIGLLTICLVVLILISACAQPAPTSPSPTSPSSTSPSSTSPKPTSAAPPSAKLPAIVTMTSLSANIGMGARGVALAEAVSKLSPMKVRIEPRDIDTAIIAPLQLGDAEFGHVTGPTMFGALKGKYKDVSPFEIRRVWKGSPFVFAMATRGDSGIKNIGDLKGKRIPQSAASPSWSINQEAALAFGGLTLKDVTVVNAPSIAAGVNGLLEGTIDAVGSAPFGSGFVELAASRYGIYWFDMPQSNTEGWKRLREIQGAGGPVALKGAPGMKQGEKIDVFGYEESVWSTPKVSDEAVYAFVKAMKEGYGTYSPMEPGLVDWTWEQAISLDGLLQMGPYHSGTIKFFKEMGVWTPEHEKFQQEALKLQNELLTKK
ncbi:MAG: TAXI family TRAP transporter solute-binding subunit [Chloroflexi bacterium]|nr:TAXI family TRAP transporter solute-binding subunit [Chloroflexota bacterium]